MGGKIQMKVVVLGAKGMLGHMVTKVFENQTSFDVVGYDRRAFDASEYCRTLDAELFADADWIINCIGTIKPKIDENKWYSISNAININSLFPHMLAEQLKTEQKIIQIATDCVYSGKTGWYKEIDLHDATDVYGKTKSLGEINHPNFYNLRCSIIGPELGTMNSLFEWVRQQPKFARIKGFHNHKWNGITTYQFAKICKQIIVSNMEIPNLLHIPATPTTKEYLVKFIASEYGRGDLIINQAIAPEAIDRTLSTDFPEIVSKFKIPSLRDQLREMSPYT